ncbi:Hypothetical protein Cp267_0057 [Corynebacterium pseudotuberculosis 267]|nr:Hypothetical protein Cp267_0057 [Corynebacterium pseudotuberculosis 267]
MQRMSRPSNMPTSRPSPMPTHLIGATLNSSTSSRLNLKQSLLVFLPQVQQHGATLVRTLPWVLTKFVDNCFFDTCLCCSASFFVTSVQVLNDNSFLAIRRNSTDVSISPSFLAEVPDVFHRRHQ